MSKPLWIVLVLPLFFAAVPSGPANAGPAFIGSKKCKKCHLKQYKSWKKTKMANVFDLLKPNERAEAKKKAGLDPAKDYTSDAKCVKCHVTGFEQEGGYTIAKADKHLKGVGCEMCHGAGGEFVRDDRMSLDNPTFKNADLIPLGFIPKPTAEQCKNCHNEESPMYKPFDFEKRVKEGVHDHIPLKNKH